MKITGTLDIECADWDRFAVAATYQPTQGGAGYGDTTIHRSIAELVDFLLRRSGSTWWAHCGGNFDFLAIAEEMRLRQIPCSVDLAGSKVSRLVGGGIVLRDSWPLVPLALPVAAKLAGEVADDLGLPCRCGHACGGYCSIRANDDRARVSDHCASDARVLYRVLRAIEEIGESMGLTMRGTLGGTAWATAKAAIGLPDADMSPGQWRRIRESYFGGRVTIIRPRAIGPGSHWDISSAYPAALARTALPIGDCAGYADRDARLCLRNERPGIYSCTITVPDCMLPPLPVRLGARVLYPTGVLRGTWTLPEINEAIERGAVVSDVRWCMVWEGAEILFDDLIRDWFARRRKAGKASALGQWIRLLGNTLTGKFAEGPNKKAAKMFPAKIRYCEGKRPCSKRACVGACGAMEQLDMWGQVWGVPFFRPATSGHVHWASYLTSATRSQWLVGAESQGWDLVYGDTDSIWTTSRTGPRPQGAALGAWELKHAWSDWECVAPRAYRFSDEHGRQVKTSGMTITDDDWTAGGAVNDRGVLSFTDAAKLSKGLFQRKHQRWTLPDTGRSTGMYGDRLLDADERVTLPVRYGQA